MEKFSSLRIGYSRLLPVWQVWFLSRCTVVRRSGFFGFEPKYLLSTFNKPVKSSARRSDGQSFYFSQVSGFAVSLALLKMN